MMVEIEKDLLDSLVLGYLPRVVKDFIQPGMYIAGGYLRQYWAGGEYPKDIDVFKVGDKYSRENINLNINGRIPIIIDLVTIPTPTVLEIIKTFDFTNSMAVIGKNKKGVWWGSTYETFYEDCAKRLLRLNPTWNKYAKKSMERLAKFAREGWKIKDEELLKLTRTWIKFEEENRNRPTPLREPEQDEDDEIYEDELDLEDSGYEDLDEGDGIPEPVSSSFTLDSLQTSAQRFQEWTYAHRTGDIINITPPINVRYF